MNIGGKYALQYNHRHEGEALAGELYLTMQKRRTRKTIPGNEKYSLKSSRPVGFLTAKLKKNESGNSFDGFR